MCIFIRSIKLAGPSFTSSLRRCVHCLGALSQVLTHSIDNSATNSTTLATAMISVIDSLIRWQKANVAILHPVCVITSDSPCAARRCIVADYCTAVSRWCCEWLSTGHKYDMVNFVVIIIAAGLFYGIPTWERRSKRLSESNRPRAEFPFSPCLQRYV